MQRMVKKPIPIRRPSFAPTTYTSYAIACVRNDQILFVRRSGTYQFTGLFGRNANGLDMDLDFFDRMTRREKIIITNPDFNFDVWFDMFHGNKLNEMRAEASSVESLERINGRIAAMRSDASKRFRTIINRKKHLIYNSIDRGVHGTFPYSLPKGRRTHSSYEKPIRTAVREFCEETNIPHDIVTVLSKEPFNISYTDDNDIYVHKIFFASVPPDTCGLANISDLYHRLEITEIVWLSKEEFKHRKPDALSKRVYYDNFERMLVEYQRAADGLSPGNPLNIPEPPANSRQRRHRDYREPHYLSGKPTPAGVYTQAGRLKEQVKTNLSS